MNVNGSLKPQSKAKRTLALKRNKYCQNKTTQESTKWTFNFKKQLFFFFGELPEKKQLNVSLENGLLTIRQLILEEHFPNMMTLLSVIQY